MSVRKPTAEYPRRPHEYYGKEWRGWGEWLGTGSIAPSRREFLSLNEAREFVHKLGLKSESAGI